MTMTLTFAHTELPGADGKHAHPARPAHLHPVGLHQVAVMIHLGFHCALGSAPQSRTMQCQCNGGSQKQWQWHSPSLTLTLSWAPWEWWKALPCPPSWCCCRRCGWTSSPHWPPPGWRHSQPWTGLTPSYHIHDLPDFLNSSSSPIPFFQIHWLLSILCPLICLLLEMLLVLIDFMTISDVGRGIVQSCCFIPKIAHQVSIDTRLKTASSTFS